MTDLDDWGFAFMDEAPVPERDTMTVGEYMARRHAAAPISAPMPQTAGRRLTREEAEASLARWQAKHPGRVGFRKAYAALGDDTTLSRFVKTGIEKPRKRKSKQLWLQGFQHKRKDAGRSIFPGTITPPSAKKRLLVSGFDNVKIGRDVRKGRLFRGYWIYTLTLEERATCPRTCHHWTTCYGNNMPWAKRLEHGPELTRRLEIEIAELLGTKRRAGILIRLHALGDFYSIEYVAFWHAMLERHPNLAVFGYTARRPGDPIHAAIEQVKDLHGARFAIRYSDGDGDLDVTRSIRDVDEKPADAFICPEQLGKTKACATCGLCWNTSKPVAFLEH